LRLYDPKTGEYLRTPEETEIALRLEKAARQIAEDKAEDELAARQAAEAKAAAAEAKAAEEADAHQAAEAKAAAAEAEIARLREELAKLRGTNA
jgi:topoisomerase IA-like protein